MDTFSARPVTTFDYGMRQTPARGRRGDECNLRLSLATMAGWFHKCVSGNLEVAISDDSFYTTKVVDPCARFLVSASGNRGWHGEATRTVFVHDIKPIV